MSLPVARVEELEGILRQELAPDETFNVRWQDGNLKVEALTELDAAEEIIRSHSVAYPYEPYEMKADIPEELRGVLLSANQRINDSGMALMFSGIVAIEALCVGIHMSWWPAIGTLAIAQLQGVWVYLLIHLIGLCVFGALMALPERRAYKKHRDLVHEAIDRSELNRFEVIGKIEGDPSLSCIATRLKKDAVSA